MSGPLVASQSEPTFLEKKVAWELVVRSGAIAEVRYFDRKIYGDPNVTKLRNFFFVFNDKKLYCDFRDETLEIEKEDTWCKYSRRQVRLNVFNKSWGRLSPLWCEYDTGQGFFQEKWVDVTVLPHQWYARLSDLDKTLPFGDLKVLQRQWNHAVRLAYTHGYKDSSDEDT